MSFLTFRNLYRTPRDQDKLSTSDFSLKNRPWRVNLCGTFWFTGPKHHQIYSKSLPRPHQGQSLQNILGGGVLLSSLVRSVVRVGLYALSVAHVGTGLGTSVALKTSVKLLKNSSGSHCLTIYTFHMYTTLII